MQANRLTVGDVELRVGTALPVGTDRARLVMVLDSLKVEHSDVDKKTRSIGARVWDPQTGIITSSFHITFAFDSTGKLVSHTTKELFTGP
jgi:hypothetical protein